MKKLIALFLFYLVSCNKTSENKNIIPDLHFTKVWKTPTSELTKIELPSNIDLDTIEGNHKTIDFTIKNTGNKILKSLFIKPPCSCIQMPEYDSVLQPKKEQKISVNMSINEIGNFYLPVTVYGTFYPFKRVFYVEGYRKS